MESKNAKSGKKTLKASRKAASKELEINLASRFLEVVKGLGHTSKGISLEIQKASKKISKKLAKAATEVLEPTHEKKLPKKGPEVKASSSQKIGTIKKVPKAVAKKELVKAKKVVSRAGTGKKGELRTGILTASSQVSNPREEDLAPQAETGVSNLTIKRNQPELPGITAEKNNDDVVSPS